MNENTKRRELLHQKFLDYQSRVAAWVSKVWNTDSDDDFSKTPEYAAAVKYWNDFKEHEPTSLDDISQDVDYGGVVPYARELFARYDASDKLLDEKADSIIKYLGGGSTLITFGTLLSLKTDTKAACIMGVVALVSLSPSLFFAVKAVWAAISVRKPRYATTLPTIKFAVEMAEYYKLKDRMELNLLLVLHPICESLHFRNFQKAHLVEIAHKNYKRAIASLGVPLGCLTVFLLILCGLRD